MGSSSPTGRGNNPLLLSNVNTSQNDSVNNPAYAVPNRLTTDGVIYEDLPSEDVTVNTTAVTAFTDDGRYSKLQRDSSVLTQSVAPTITGDHDDNVEAYYGRLDNSEQYAVSAWYMCWKAKLGSTILYCQCMYSHTIELQLCCVCTYTECCNA